MRTPAAQLSRWSLPKRARRHRQVETTASSQRVGRARAPVVAQDADAPEPQSCLFQSTLGGAPGPKSGWRVPAIAAVALHALALGVALAVPPEAPAVELRPEEPEVVFLQFSPAARWPPRSPWSGA